jgi:hypothetical protein
VLRAYILVRQMPERLKLLAHKHATEEERVLGFALAGGDYFEVVRQMHENYLDHIDLALAVMT